MTQCPCDDKAYYVSCCEPIIKGAAKAASAEALMRARYTAYTQTEIKFLKESMHPKIREEFDEASVREWSTQAEWQGLEIVATENGGENDKEGLVEFIAFYSVDEEDEQHHEWATFKKDDAGSWFFFDSKVNSVETIVRDEPKTGRNDPCTCGSGKKFKKCCG